MDFPEEWKKKGVDPEKLSIFGIENDRWDREDLERLVRSVEMLAAAREHLGSKVPTGRNAMDDTLWSLFKVDPKPLDASEVRPSHLPNLAVDIALLELAETERLRRFTVGDDVQAAMSAAGLEKELTILFDQHQARQRSAAQQLEDALKSLCENQQARDALEEMISKWAEQADVEDQATIVQAFDYQDQRDALNAEAEALMQAAADAAKELADAQGDEPTCSMGVRVAVGNEADKAESLQMAASSWGTEPGDIRSLDPAKRMELARKMMSPTFKRMADLIGAMRNDLFTEQSRKVDYIREEVFDVGMGNDLGRILPSELLNLDGGPKEADFLRRWSEHKLLQYEMRGTEKLTRGGIYYLCDSSESMAGDKDEWAKAVGMCFLHLARKQKRQMHFIHFGSRTQVKVFSFTKPADYALDRILECAGFFFGGGTDFMAPLDTARKLLDAEHAATGAVTGDVVLATDGISQVTAPWLQEYQAEQERLGFKIYGITIGGSRTADPLATICGKKVMSIADLMSGKDLRPLFREL